MAIDRQTRRIVRSTRRILPLLLLCAAAQAQVAGNAVAADHGVVPDTSKTRDTKADPVYVVVAIDIEDPEKYKRYVEAQEPVVAPYHVETIAVDQSPVFIEGTKIHANNFFIAKFRSMEDFQKLYHSEAYKKAMQLRLGASTTRFIMVLHSWNPDKSFLQQIHPHSP